jgi:hypothetical protein
MRKLFILVSILFPVGLIAQTTGVLPVYTCLQDGVQALTSGLPSSNYLQGIIPYCTVIVYLTMTQTIATTTPQSPFTANMNGSIPPIYAAVNQGYDVVLSGGISPNTYPSPKALTGLYPGGGLPSPCYFTTSLGIPCGGTGASTQAGAFTNIVGPGGTMTGPLAAPSINNVLYVGTPGGYANLAAANAAAIAAGGGTIITAPGYTETLSNIVIGASGAPVFWLAGTGTMITVTGTTGIQFYSGSGSSCDVAKSCHIITAQTSGSPISLVSNYPQDGTGGSIFLDGWFIDGGSEAVSFSDAEVSLGNVFANSYLRDVSIERCGANIGLHVTSTVSTGGGTNVIYIDNPNIECDDNYGARPLVVDFSGTGQLSAVTIEGGTVENPGCGQHGATFDGHGSIYKLYSILWEGTQIQGNPCTSPPVTTITGYSVSSDVVTLSYTGQKPAIGLTGTFSGLSRATFLNGKALPVLPAGLTSSTFEVAYVTGNVGTTSDSGSFTPSEVSDMYVVDTQAMTIIGSDEANGGESAAVELNQTVTNGLGSIVIENVRSGGGSLPPVINDVSGYQTPAGTYIEPLYVYPGSGAAAPATFDGTTAFTQPVALAVQAEGPQSVSGPNLVPNGNFQTGYPGSVATGWTLSGNGGATCTGLLDNTTYPPINTTNSQKVTISGSTGSCTLTSGSFAVSSGKRYQVAVWMRNDGSVMSFSAYTGLYNSSGVLICQPVWNGGWPTLTTSWVQVTGECTATGSDAAAVFKIPYTLGYGSVWIGNVWSAAQSLPPVPGWGNAVILNASGNDSEVCTTAGGVNGNVVTFDSYGNCQDSGVALSAPAIAVTNMTGTGAFSITGNAATATSLAATPTSAVGQATCWKASGVLGYCSSVVGVGGTCTCN